MTDASRDWGAGIHAGRRSTGYSLERAAKKCARFFAPRALYTLKPISFSAFERFRSNAG
jgi:hypothetical protein